MHARGLKFNTSMGLQICAPMVISGFFSFTSNYCNYDNYNIVHTSGLEFNTFMGLQMCAPSAIVKEQHYC